MAPAARVSVVCLILAQSLTAAELTEPASDKRTFSVRSRLQVAGTIQTATPGGKSIGLKMNVDAKLSYLERRLPSGGKEAESLRSMRKYDIAEAAIDIGGRKTTNRLSTARSLIVAEGQRPGVRTWSPAGPMTYDHLELLRTPGDSLALMGLLPTGEVTSTSSWAPPDWVISMLAGVEAVTKSELKCRMTRLDSQYGIIQVDGSVEGAVLGAMTKISVSGQVAYDVAKKFIRQAKIIQAEERAVGAVSPGMKIKATMYVDRQVASNSGPLTDNLLASIPVNPSRQNLSLSFDSPWKLRFGFDRNWHIFHQTGDVAVLRLMENGALIAQCNVSQRKAAPAGSHTSEQDFQNDIRSTLKGQLSEIVRAQELKTNDGRFLYRVTAVGTSRDKAMNWFYYLCAAPDGRQTAFVFSIESRFVEQLANRDIAMVETLQFLPTRTAVHSSPQK